MMIFVTPKSGMQVRNPDINFAPLPAAGDMVTDSGYWRMHHRDGAVTISTGPAAVVPAPARVASPPPSPVQPALVGGPVPPITNA